jgi:hypothetical protein
MANFEDPFDPETEPRGFNILRVTDADIYLGVEQKIKDGILPKDTFLRLASIGHLQEDEDGAILMRRMLAEIDAPADDRALSEDTRELIFGKLPTALLDWNESDFDDYLRSQAHMYYRKGHLVDIIEERRKREGKTISEPIRDRRLRNEKSVCRGLAHNVWRALVREARPEWLDERNLEAYYQPAIRTNSVVFELDAQLMRRRIVNAAVLSDVILHGLYDRAKSTGIRGIGRVAIVDMGSLLTEEHPELL